MGAYSVSNKSSFDRGNIFDVPNYTQMIDKIKQMPNDDRRIALATIVATGCRVSEVLYLKKSHIKFFNSENVELPEGFSFSDIFMVQFNLYTEKNRATKYRIVPLIMNDLFHDLIKLIYEHWLTIEYQESYVIQTDRIALWRAVKAFFGKDYYPHFLRHASVTNDTRAGINPAILKSKYGWTDLRPHSVYSHLNYIDLMEAQKRVFGIATKAKQVIPSVDTTPIEKETLDKIRKVAEARIAKQRGKQQQFRKIEPERTQPTPDVALV